MNKSVVAQQEEFIPATSQRTLYPGLINYNNNNLEAICEKECIKNIEKKVENDPLIEPKSSWKKLISNLFDVKFKNIFYNEDLFID